MTISLEHVLGDEVVRRNFERLAALALDTGGESVGIRFGTATVTWAGASGTSGTLVVSHGLGTTPLVTLASVMGTASDSSVVFAFTGSAPGGSTFNVAARNPSAIPVNGTTAKVAWLAIG